MEVTQSFLHLFAFFIGVFVVLLILSVIVIKLFIKEDSKKDECEHKGIQFGIVQERNCTVEKTVVFCGQCGKVLKRIVET